LVDPGSSLSFDFYIGNNMRVNLHDSFSISDDPTEQANLSNTGRYLRFENTAGISLLWDLNAFVISASYDHFDFRSLTGDYKSLDRRSELFSAAAYYYVSEATKIGVTASPSFNDFIENYQNDSVLFSVGPFIEMNPLQYLKIRAAAGSQTGDFSSGGANQDSSQLSTYYYNLGFAHRINPFMTETLHVGHEAQLGLSTNSEEIDYIRYALQLGIVRDFPIGLNAFYERLNDSPGMGAEKINRYGGGCKVGWQATARWNLSLEYQFLSKDSNQEFLSYKQNRVSFTATYQF
jgi:hypothetical protein